MIDEHDAKLQRIFDERLMRVLPPPRMPRRRRSAARFAAASLAVLLTAGGFAFAADVNGTAEAAGLSCTDVLAKVEIWWESVRNGTMQQQIEFKQRAAALVGQTCDARGNKAPLPDKPILPASEPMVKPEIQPSAACLAAQVNAKEMAMSASGMTREQELALKQRLNAMLAEACQAK